MKPALLVLAFTAAFGITIGLAHYRIRDFSAAAELQRQRASRAEARLASVESRRVLADPDGVVARLAATERAVAQCEARLADVRLVLDTLIREDRWPGRVELPRPVSDWPPWPVRGAAIGSITMPDRCGWPPVACAGGGR